MPPDSTTHEDRGSVGHALVVRDLVVRFGSHLAVAGLSFTAASGAVTALLGPNGAGKTSTIETCEGYRSPTSGSVRVLGRDPVRDGNELRPRVGVMLQEGGIYSAARAVPFLRHIAAFYADPLDVDALAELLGLDRIGRTPFRRMSGGEQQRVKLAAAIVGRPQVVFLDEPSAGLDPQARLIVWDLVRGLRRSGVCVVLTTHDMDEAEDLADHVVIIDSGSVVVAGTPSQLTGGTERDNTSLSFTATAGLPVHALDAHENRRAEGADLVMTETRPGRYVVTGTIDPQALMTISNWCRDNAIAPSDFTTGRRSLEDVFLELTGRELRP